jgi:hypothetical protein
MNDLTAFLNARLDEDEAVAKEACEPDVSRNGEWTAYGHPPGMRDGRKDRDVQLVGAGPDEARWTVCEVGQWDRAPMVGEHIARHDPARVLREVAALRSVVADCIKRLAYPANAPLYNVAPRTLAGIAAIWSDHPDYRSEWTS